MASSMFTNPAVSRVEKFDDAFMGQQTASLKGILGKSVYFLATILLGMAAFLYMHSYFGSQGYTSETITDGYRIYANELSILGGVFILTLICGLVAAFARRTIPVTGTIYCAGMGYALTFISYTYAAVYSGIILEALLITILIIAIMGILYATKIVHVGQGFMTVVYTALFASVIGGLLFALMIWIAPNSAIVSSIVAAQNGPIGILFAVLGVLLGAALLLCDFETIARTVDNGLSKDYEWYCSYSLMVSVIYLYLKVLQLLARLHSRRR